MPVNYYPNKTLVELRDILTRLQDRQLKGGITQVAAAGVNTVRSFDKSSKTEQEILRVRYALFLKDPTHWANPYGEKITRTRAWYTAS
jgi:hypothetical protein